MGVGRESADEAFVGLQGILDAFPVIKVRARGNRPFAGPINAQRGVDIINAYSLAFFDQHLESRPATLLDGPSKNYPEIIFSARSAA